MLPPDIRNPPIHPGTSCVDPTEAPIRHESPELLYRRGTAIHLGLAHAFKAKQLTTKGAAHAAHACVVARRGGKACIGLQATAVQELGVLSILRLDYSAATAHFTTALELVSASEDPRYR